jgi:hypothetical protein
LVSCHRTWSQGEPNCRRTRCVAVQCGPPMMHHDATDACRHRNYAHAHTLHAGLLASKSTKQLRSCPTARTSLCRRRELCAGTCRPIFTQRTGTSLVLVVQESLRLHPRLCVPRLIRARPLSVLARSLPPTYRSKCGLNRRQALRAGCCPWASLCLAVGCAMQSSGNANTKPICSCGRNAAVSSVPCGPCAAGQVWHMWTAWCQVHRLLRFPRAAVGA